MVAALIAQAPGGSSAPVESPAHAMSQSKDERLEHARDVIRLEARTIARLEDLIGDAFLDAVERILACEGVIVVTGMGKAGIVGQKISATLASTGTPSIFLHPAEALHGDLGRIRADDLVLALSNSGETHEIKLVIPAARRIGAGVIAMTGQPDSTLGRLADCVLDIGRVDEACPLGLAPTASTSALLALGDALAMVVSKASSFSRGESALFDTAGALGRKLMPVSDVMRQGGELPLARAGTSLGDVLRVMGETAGRPGAALIVDGAGTLVGIFTDGDLRRLFEERGQLHRSEPIDAFMGKHPKTVQAEALLEEAERLLREHKVDQMPVLDEEGRPVGLLDVQDLLDTRF